MIDTPWISNRSGQPIDLVEPRVDQVDFRDMAWALANLNRYAGHGDMQVSVALHLMVGLDLCPEPLKPWWLLHDGHEERLGEITTPALKALCALAAEVDGDGGRDIVERALGEFRRRHDVVIHAAAGLPMPTSEQRRALKEIDLRCLATEHRDFHRPSTRSWAHEACGIQPARKLRRWASPDKLAEALLARFERHLPALRAAA